MIMKVGSLHLFPLRETWGHSIQRKVFTQNDVESLREPQSWILRFKALYERSVASFERSLACEELKHVLAKLSL
jgi:hypothetical protein